jgi:hypothetical protein
MIPEQACGLYPGKTVEILRASRSTKLTSSELLWGLWPPAGLEPTPQREGVKKPGHARLFSPSGRPSSGTIFHRLRMFNTSSSSTLIWRMICWL